MAAVRPKQCHVTKFRARKEVEWTNEINEKGEELTEGKGDMRPIIHTEFITGLALLSSTVLMYRPYRVGTWHNFAS
jgi:hypothetical protein